MGDLRLEDLLTGQRIHRSRNPRLVRALVDLGAVRDQGEGIPRMFAEMEGLFLPAPTLAADRRGFTIVLCNTPTLSLDDRSFVSSLGSEELADPEFRVLLDASRRGRVDNARVRAIAGLDTLSASRMLVRLRDRDLLTQHGRGAATYYTLGVMQAADRAQSDRGISKSHPARDAASPMPDRMDGAAPIAPCTKNRRGHLAWSSTPDRGEPGRMTVEQGRRRAGRREGMGGGWGLW